MGEAIQLWSVCQAFKSSIQKPGADNFAAVFFWPALLCITGWVWFAIFWWDLRIFPRCISWECLLPGILAGAPGPACPPAVVLRTHCAFSELLAGQPVEPLGSCAADAQLHKIQVSAQFRVATSAFISFCNCGSWLLLPFKGFVLKVMGNYWIAIFFRAQWVSSKPLSAHLPREFSRLLWKPSLRDVSPWKDCSQVLLGTAWPPVPWATGAFWKGHSAASLGMGGGSLLSFGLGFCRSFW